MATSKYNKSKIMGNAHKLYKNARTKYITFSAALRKAWQMAKFEAAFLVDRKAVEAKPLVVVKTTEAKQEQKANVFVRTQKEQFSNEYLESMSLVMGYGNGRYMGD